MVERIHPYLLCAHEDRGGPHVDIHERPVLARPMSGEVDLLAVPELLAGIDRLGAHLVRSSDEVVDVAPDRLLPRVPEEPLRRRIP